MANPLTGFLYAASKDISAIAFCNRIAELVERNGFPSVKAVSDAHFLRDESGNVSGSASHEK